MKNQAKKPLLTLLFSAAFAVAGLVQAEEVKQSFKGQTVNANLEFADGKGYGDEFVLLLHGTLTHKGRWICRTILRRKELVRCRLTCRWV